MKTAHVEATYQSELQLMVLSVTNAFVGDTILVLLMLIPLFL